MPVEQRASQSIAFRLAESVGGTVINLLVGAALFTPGIIGFTGELRHNYDCDEALHIGHIGLFVGLMVAGALVVRPSFGKSLTAIFVTVLPNGLPILGGKRASDPQPKPEDPPP